jgi:hypothetical protein
MVSNYGFDWTDEPFTADLGALYGPSVLHMRPSFMYVTVVNAFKGIKTSDLLCPGQ